jgi:hypothetical protein
VGGDTAGFPRFGGIGAENGLPDTNVAGIWKWKDSPRRAFLEFSKETFWPGFDPVTFMNWWRETGRWGVWGPGWRAGAGDGGWKHGNIAPIHWRLFVIIAREPKFMEVG